MKCKMQGGMEMSEDWCQLAQYTEICCGCERDKGREVSLWQEKQKEEKGEDDLQTL
jgi:hypothetical protein